MPRKNKNVKPKEKHGKKKPGVFKKPGKKKPATSDTCCDHG
jgi:hypothetical protein